MIYDGFQHYVVRKLTIICT